MIEKNTTDTKNIFRLWWWFLLFKLVVSTLIPLSQDETYYWIWSKYPQLSYFDHPAMVSWLMTFGHIFEPLGHAVRWPAVLMGHVTLLIWIKIFKNFKAAPEKISIWMWLALTSPLIGLGSIIVTPDLPVVFFWSLSVLFAQRILQQNSVKDYSLLGASLGLGFCSKYHIVLFVPSLLLYLFISKEIRKINVRGVLLTIFFGLVFSSPVLIWNYQNNFASFKFQLNHGLGEKTWNPDWTLGYLIGQFLLLFPTTIWAALKSYKNKFLAVFSFFPLLFFLFSSLKGVVEVNWPIVAYPSFLALAALSTVSKNLLRISSFFWGLITVGVIAVSIYPIDVELPEKLTENRYFDSVYSVSQKYSPLYLGSYQMASAFWYKFKTPFMKLYQINRHDLFDEVNTHAPAEKKYFVLKETWVPLPDWMTADMYNFTKIKDLPPKFELYEVIKK